MPADNFLWFETPAKSSSQMSATNATQPQGESKDKFFGQETDYKAFEVLSFTFGVAQAETTGSATGGSSAGRAKFEDFTITKWVDKASVPLYNACAAGAHFPTVMLVIRKAGGSGLRYLQYIFRQVFVTNISWDGGTGEENFKETVKFKFGALGIQYARQLPDGTADTAINSSWSCLANKSTLEVPPLPSPKGFVDVEQK
jgi:type VI secretion system secreted protein Hcp